MTDLNASMFDFGAMKTALGSDPFAEQKPKYAKDERFYTLAKDKDGNGAALIRFLPDSEKGMIQQLFKIGTTIVKNGKKRFVSEFSPSTIGQPCPFQEEWQSLWNAGDKDGAKNYGRGVRFVSNIKIIKDPANPENEGKIFLYEYSGALKTKLQAALQPSEQDLALGAKPKQLFNPVAGNSFRLVAAKGSNNQINYDSSAVVDDVTSIYGSVEEALTDLKENTHKLSDLVAPESFMSYDDLVKKKAWVTFADQDAKPEVQEVQEVKTEAVQTVEVKTEAKVEPKAEPKVEAPADDLDALLAGLT